MDQANLIRMANQIARNLEAQGVEAAVEQTARHIRDYWEPRMIRSLLDADGAGMSPIVQQARCRLDDRGQ